MSQFIDNSGNSGMRTWKIRRPFKYTDNDKVIAEVAEVEYHDEYMGESYLTVTVNSEEPIDFEIRDYIKYRGQIYSLSVVPACKQQASKGSSGNAFVYENMKFNSVANELATCEFLDVVLDDNGVHWTALPTFSFYCENVKALADRIQANLDRVYKPIYGDDSWVVEVGNYEDFDEEITIDKQSVWDALALVDTTFHSNFIIRGRHIYIGTEGTSVDHVFKCGVGNGLVSLERTVDDSQKVITRLRAYGNTTNMPNSYYLYETMKLIVFITNPVKCLHSAYQLVNRNGVCYVTQIGVDKKSDIYKFRETIFNNIGDRLIIQTIGSDPNYPEYSIDLEHPHPYVTLYYKNDFNDNSEELKQAKCYINYYDAESKSILYLEVVEFDTPTFRDFFMAKYGNGTSSYYDTTKYVYFHMGGDNIAFDDLIVNHPSLVDKGYYPNNMAVTRIMLPEFPSEYGSYKYLGEIDEKYKEYKLVFNKSDVYIESPNISPKWIVEGSVYIDGTDNEYTKKDIYPSIEGVTFGDLTNANILFSGTHTKDERIDEISKGGCTSVDKTGRLDNGNKFYNKNLGSECYVYIKDIGFDINNVLSKGETPVLHMKSGMCVGREFDITQVVSYKSDNNGYRLTIARKDDDDLNIRFPNSDYNIKKGDRFVLLHIKPPSVFYKTASERLLREALKYFVNNDFTRFAYTPTIDNLWVAREHRKKEAEGREDESIYSTIYAGDLMMVESDDLGIGTSVRISSLTIKENAQSPIPEFDIQLQDKKSVGAIQRIQNKLEDYTNSGGGGLSYDQVKTVISDSGSYKFISKRNDDFAEGQITMEKGLIAQSSHNGSETAADGLIEYYTEEES